MKLFKTPRFVRWFYPDRTWSFSLGDTYHLTFDDGPNPLTTPYLLAWLKERKLKATFFCVGENVRLYPELFQQIINEGHNVGNHTMRHEKGWKTNDADYIKSVREAAEFIPSKLFRPPYGKMKRSQARKLKAEGYEIMMWSWLTYDFDVTVPTEKIKKFAPKFRAGDIIVLHDNPKHFERTKAMLTYF